MENDVFPDNFKRYENEITKKNNPVKGDWIELVQKDFSDIGMEINEEVIKS